ncbi:hypothetical protein Btru_009230, partial [Bulinus truncatus]
AILKTPNSGGLTYTDKALNSIINNRMFDPINGGRSDARDIVITLTDGQSNNPTATAAAANALKTKGATLFSVGITLGNNNGELVKLASNAEFVFNVDNFDRLDNFLYQLAQKTCTSSGGVEKPVVACEAQADIVLVTDSSGSIGPKNYWKVLNFSVELANQFKIGKNAVLFGSVVFSDSAQKWFDLKDNLNIESLRRNILKEPYLNSTTSTDKALDLVRNANMFGRSAGGRDGAQNIVILITDGASDYPDKTIAAAGKLKTLQDTSIITLGIGNAKRAELEAVASSKSDVFLVNSFDALNNVKQNIATRACAHKANSNNRNITDKLKDYENWTQQQINDTTSLTTSRQSNDTTSLTTSRQSNDNTSLTTSRQSNDTTSLTTSRQSNDTTSLTTSRQKTTRGLVPLNLLATDGPNVNCELLFIKTVIICKDCTLILSLSRF